MKLFTEFNIETQEYHFFLGEGDKMVSEAMKWDERPHVVVNRISKAMEKLSSDSGTTLAPTPEKRTSEA